MFKELKDKGIQTAYLPFEGEGHGFRQAKNQKRSLDAELYFYGKVLGFTPAGDLEPVDIANAK
jgi:dipeptidyl aminopeptidase/acylaminoacyl peptidase